MIVFKPSYQFCMQELLIAELDEFDVMLCYFVDSFKLVDFESYLFENGCPEMIYLLFDVSLDKIDSVWSSYGSDVGQAILTAARAVDHSNSNDISVRVYVEADDHCVCSNDPAHIIACKYLYEVWLDVLKGQRLLLKSKWTKQTTSMLDDIEK